MSRVGSCCVSDRKCGMVVGDGNVTICVSEVTLSESGT